MRTFFEQFKLDANRLFIRNFSFLFFSLLMPASIPSAVNPLIGNCNIFGAIFTLRTTGKALIPVGAWLKCC
jgi:hypothetical protein